MPDRCQPFGKSRAGDVEAISNWDPAAFLLQLVEEIREPRAEAVPPRSGNARRIQRRWVITRHHRMA